MPTSPNRLPGCLLAACLACLALAPSAARAEASSEVAVQAGRRAGRPAIDEERPPERPPLRTSEGEPPDQAHLPYLIAGSLTWLLSYLADPLVSLGGGISEEGPTRPGWGSFRLAAWIPFGGPWVQLGQLPVDDPGWKAFLVIDGLAQLAGLALLIGGLVMPSARPPRARAQAELSVTPFTGPHRLGLLLRARL